MKKIIDIATVILLIAAFAVAFSTGMILKKSGGYDPVLETNLFVLISVVGTVALLCVGMISTLNARIKKNYITKSFLAFAIVQMGAAIGMLTIMFMLWTSMFSIDNKVIWVLYIIFVLIIIAGYADSMAFTDKLEALNAAAAASDENDDDAAEVEVSGEAQAENGNNEE